MTRRDLACVHEPFGDAFYFGYCATLLFLHKADMSRPERMGVRYENDEEARKASGFADSTYNTVFERLEREGSDVRAMFRVRESLRADCYS